MNILIYFYRGSFVLIIFLEILMIFTKKDLVSVTKIFKKICQFYALNQN